MLFRSWNLRDYLEWYNISCFCHLLFIQELPVTRMEMNDHSILLDVDPNVLQYLRNNATSDVPTSLRTTNVATSLGIMNQLGIYFCLTLRVVTVSVKCEDIFEEISSRFFDLNKRITKAQKSISDFETQVESKSRFLLYSDIENIYSEPAGIALW